MKITLHIGFSKTGSTALQQFLFQNRNEFLKNRNVRVVTEFGQRANSSQLALYAINQNQPSFLQNYFVRIHQIRSIADHDRLKTQVLQKFVKLRRASPGEHLIISSELLSQHLVTPEEVSRLAGLLRTASKDIRVIAFVRRQDDRMLSGYSQRIKGGQNKKFERVIPLNFLDYKPPLDVWAAVFGKENLIVRVFERSSLVNGDVIDDFLHHAGISDGEFERPGMVNESLCVEALEFLRLLNEHVPPIDAETGTPSIFRQGLPEALIKWGRRRSRPEISPEFREKILSAFEESNAAIAREYLGGERTGLFAESNRDASQAPEQGWIDSGDFTLAPETIVEICAYLWRSQQTTIHRQEALIRRLLNAHQAVKQAPAKAKP